MSKTLDNDHKITMPSTFVIEEQAAEIERLKAEGVRQREHSASWFDEAHKLRAQVEAMEAANEELADELKGTEAIYLNALSGVKKERDALREDLSNAEFAASMIFENENALRAELEQIKGEKMGYDKSSYEQQTYSSYSREDLKDEIKRLRANYERLQVAYRYEKNENDTLQTENKRLNGIIQDSVHWNNMIKEDSDVLRTKLNRERDANHTLRARVEELTIKALDALDERDELKQRVEELEAELKYDHEEYKRLRDALRAELEQQTALAIRWMDSYNELALPGEQIKGENMGEDRTWNLEPVTTLRAENARLKNNIEGLNYIIGKLEAELAKAEFMRDTFQKSAIEYQAELAALKPKPVVVERYLFVTGSSGYADLDGQRVNVKVTYTDGVLTGAEIVK